MQGVGVCATEKDCSPSAAGYTATAWQPQRGANGTLFPAQDEDGRLMGSILLAPGMDRHETNKEAGGDTE